jgi:hypothetical protein
MHDLTADECTTYIRRSMKELLFEITAENYNRAVTAASGACIAADAIKEAYPQFTNVRVNVATTRVTDKEKGVRHTYLTPPSVADALLYFDQGWREEELPKKLRIRELVRTTPITRSASSIRSTQARRKEQLAELEAKEKSGAELTRDDKMRLTKLRNPKPAPVRPPNEGRPVIKGSERNEVIYGGRDRLIEGATKNPNLLAGRTRHFGAKTAKPSQVFKEAVERETQKRVQEAVEEALRAEREKQE